MSLIYTPDILFDGENRRNQPFSEDGVARTTLNPAKYLPNESQTKNAIRMDEGFVYSESGVGYPRVPPRDMQHVHERRLPFMRRTEAKGRDYYYFQVPGQKRVRLPHVDDPGFDHAYLCQLARLEGAPDPEYIYPSRSVVYFVAGAIGGIKIGLSNRIEQRLASLNAHSPIPLMVLATTPGGQKEERGYHSRFAAYRMHGEWFHRAPEICQEIERLNPSLVGLLLYTPA